jgi:hypothetical protein
MALRSFLDASDHRTRAVLSLSVRYIGQPHLNPSKDPVP